MAEMIKGPQISTLLDQTHVITIIITIHSFSFEDAHPANTKHLHIFLKGCMRVFTKYFIITFYQHPYDV